MVQIVLYGATPTWWFSYGSGMGMPNLICKKYFGRLLKTHSHSLNDASLRTLMVEVERIIKDTLKAYFW